MILAAGVLTWMLFWMQQNSGKMQTGFKSDIQEAANNGQIWGLFAIAFFAVLREGVETAFFLTAAALSGDSLLVFLGGLLGIAIAIFVGWGLSAATLRLDMKRFFQLTSLLLVLFAAGLFAHGTHEFIEVGWIAPIIDPIWDVNLFLEENSFVGSMLKVIFGYNGNLSLTEALAYAFYFVLIFLFTQRIAKKRQLTE